MHFVALAYVGESSRAAAFILSEQCQRQRHTLSRDDQNAARPGGVFVDLGHLWRSEKNPNSGRTSAMPNQSLLVFQTRRRANAADLGHAHGLRSIALRYFMQAPILRVTSARHMIQSLI